MYVTKSCDSKDNGLATLCIGLSRVGTCKTKYKAYLDVVLWRGIVSQRIKLLHQTHMLLWEEDNGLYDTNRQANKGQ